MSQNGHSYRKEAIIRHHIWTVMATRPGLKSKKDISASDGCHAQLRRNEMHGCLIHIAVPGVNGDTSFSDQEISCFLHLARSTLFSGPEGHRHLRWAATSFNGPVLWSGLRLSSLKRGTPVSPMKT